MLNREPFTDLPADCLSILVVDDDPHLREVVSFALSKEGYRVETASDGQAGLDAFLSRRHDLVILDMMMPRMRGIDVCKKLRAASEVPIIFLTSMDDEIDRIIGLELGADDYVTKPFNLRELMARVRTILRRSARKITNETKEPSKLTSDGAALVHGPIALRPESYLATCNDSEIDLTPIEFRMLQLLIEKPQRVFEREALMRRAYDDVVKVSDRTIDSHIRKIRGKFADSGIDPIETVHGVGYRIVNLRKV